MSRQFFNGEGGKLAAIHHGTGKDHVFVALHGVTGFGTLWHGFATELADQAEVIAIDFRGHGNSDWSDQRAYTTADHCLDIQAVWPQLPLEGKRVTLIGSSWGALVGISLLAAGAVKADQFIIVDVEPSFAATATDVAPRPYRFQSLEAVVSWEKSANPSASKEDVERFAIDSVTKAENEFYYRRHDPFFLDCWPFRNDNLWLELSRLDLPGAIVHGSRSFVRYEVCAAMKSLQPAWRLAEIEDSGHLVPLEQPARLAEVARELLQD